ncbi:hypothetical protein EYF80_044539 [Liparis tanakae]|uniref:Uncharacterized protein n=1 Tax=Liparis tanakae TaxID=230148 RepID=A0A4Z2FVH3_9TELE|nr:hypothetical protein EYF80_044539 [Liparis tanakae]
MAFWIEGPWETESADRTGRSAAGGLCGLGAGRTPTEHPASDRSINDPLLWDGQEESERASASQRATVFSLEEIGHRIRLLLEKTSDAGGEKKEPSSRTPSRLQRVGSRPGGVNGDALYPETGGSHDGTDSQTSKGMRRKALIDKGDPDNKYWRGSFGPVTHCLQSKSTQSPHPDQ